MAEINDLNITDASNTARFPESQAPSSVNDGARALEGIIARGVKDTIDGCVTTGGTSTAYTVAANRTLTAYYDGLTMCVKWHTASGATPTVNVDSLGAKSLYWPNGTQITTSDLPQDSRALIQYDGTNFQVLNSSAAISSFARTLLDDAAASNMRTTLGLVIGTDVLAPTGSGSSLTGIRKQGLETVWVPAVAMYTRTTNGAASGTVETGTSLVMRKSFDFDTTTQEFAQFAVMFPKSWNESTVTFAPVWTAASGSGGVVFGLAGVALSDDDALNTAFGTAQTSTDTLITAADVHVGPTSSAITIAGTPAAGDWVAFQINRTVADGSDTLGVDANLLGVRLFFTTDASDDT